MRSASAPRCVEPADSARVLIVVVPDPSPRSPVSPLSTAALLRLALRERRSCVAGSSLGSLGVVVVERGVPRADRGVMRADRGVRGSSDGKPIASPCSTMGVDDSF